MNRTDVANKITESAINYFGNKLVSILLYGSSLSARKIPNDLDIIVILKERESPEDLSFLRFERTKYQIEIDLQIINLSDIDPRSFAHDTHGQFVIHFLSQARAIYGENPFTELFPRYTDSITSIIQKAQYYYFRAKKIQANTIHPDNEKGFSFHRKKLILMLSDFWLAYSGKIVSSLEKDELEKIISALTKKKVEKDEIDSLLDNNISLNWDYIFTLYQKYYFAILDTLRPHPKKTSTFIGNIYTECKSVNSRKSVIIASGCPSDYDENEISYFLNIRGYDVVSFHYTATGKSTGHEFRKPQDDLYEVIMHYTNNYSEICVLGNSYGGYAALSVEIEMPRNIKKIIAVSPVIEFKNLEGVDTLPEYLNKSYPGWYRFKKQEFVEFTKNSPQINVDNLIDTAIIHGEFDEEIKIEEVETFCKNSKISLKSIKTKHLSLNRLSREHLYTLDELL